MRPPKGPRGSVVCRGQGRGHEGAQLQHYTQSTILGWLLDGRMEFFFVISVRRNKYLSSHVQYFCVLEFSSESLASIKMLHFSLTRQFDLDNYGRHYSVMQRSLGLDKLLFVAGVKVCY